MDVGWIIQLSGLVGLLLNPHFMAWACGILVAIGATHFFKKAPFLRKLESDVEREARRWYLRGFSIGVGTVFGGVMWQPILFTGWRSHIEPALIGTTIGVTSFLVYDSYVVVRRAWIRKNLGEDAPQDGEETRLM